MVTARTVDQAQNEMPGTIVTTGSGEVHRLPEEPRKMESLGGFSLLMPAYYSSKRALDRFVNVMTPVFASKNIFIISLMPGWPPLQSRSPGSRRRGWTTR